MNTLSQMLAFLGVMSLVWAVAHIYVGRRLLRKRSNDRPEARRLRRLGWAVLGTLWAMGPATFVLQRQAPGLPEALVWFAFAYMGVFAVVFVLLLVRDLAFALWVLGEKGVRRPPDLERRRFLTDATNYGALGATGLLSAWGAWETQRLAEVVEVDIPVEGLAPDLDGYRIAQISDLHVGPLLKRTWLTDIVERVNALNADLVAVTGDLIDGSVATLRKDIAPLGELRGRDGVFFVTGNHEYYWDAEAWCEHVRSLGLIVLLNEHRVIERGGARLAIAGCTDYGASRHLAAHRSDPKKAVAGAEDADLKVLLAHQPKSIDAAAAAGYDLQLSGHTHGGQFFPFSLVVGFAHPFSEGLGRRDRTWIYVNRGTGFWGPPLRQAVPAEITLARLVAA